MDDFKDIHVGSIVMFAGQDREARPAIVTEVFPAGRLNLVVFARSSADGVPGRLGQTSFASASHGAPELVGGAYKGPEGTWHRRISSLVPGGGE